MYNNAKTTIEATQIKAVGTLVNSARPIRANIRGTMSQPTILRKEMTASSKKIRLRRLKRDKHK